MPEKNEQIELEYRKLLQEYNAILLALFTVPLGIMGLSFNATRNIALTLLFGGMIYLFLNSYKDDKSIELENKVLEIQ